MSFIGRKSFTIGYEKNLIRRFKYGPRFKESFMKMLVLIILMLPFSFHATAKVYRVPVIPAPNTSVKMYIPYTFGTHKGEVRLFSGSLILDLQDPANSQGEFSVPINSLNTGKEERDCHMMEALGLDYGEADYPETHVCTETNNLPTAGKNAPKYKTIHLKVLSLKSQDPSKMINTDKATSIEVEGAWTIHGKTYQWTFPMKLIPEGEKFRVKGEVPFSLKNHDIIVKSTNVLFMDVSVKDIITVYFDLLLEPDA